jgi:hypothetical protein
METISWNGKQVSQFTVIGDLWQQYIGGDREVQSGNYLQRLHMLQESIRKAMRQEHESYLNGKAMAGRVAETKGHAVLVGKIIANWQRWLEAQQPQRVTPCSGMKSDDVR